MPQGLQVFDEQGRVVIDGQYSGARIVTVLHNQPYTGEAWIPSRKENERILVKIFSHSVG